MIASRFRNRISCWILFPVLITGIGASWLLFHLLTPSLLSYIKDKTYKDLMLATEMGMNICDENLDTLLSLRLTDDPNVAQSMRRDAMQQILALKSQFHSLDLILIHRSGEVLASSISETSIELDHMDLRRGRRPPWRVDISGGPVHLYSQYFPFWKWHVVSMVQEKHFLAPVQMAKTTVMATTLGTLAALVMAFMTSFRFMVRRPLSNMIEATANIAEGRFKKVQTGRKDEIGQVMSGFNSMVDHLKEDQQHIDRVMTELAASEASYRSVFENTGTATLIIELDTTISMVNKEMELLSGYAQEEIEHRMSWKDFVADSESLARMTHYHAQRRIDPTNVPNVYEFRFRTKNNELKVIQTRVDIIPGTMKSVASFLDVTEYREALESLKNAKELAESANLAKSEFLANMSHEIRTPMNGVLGMLQLMQMTEMTKEQAEYVSIALESGRSLLTVINDVLDFSKIEAGRVEIATSPFNLHDTIRSVAQSFMHQCSVKGLELALDLDQAVPEMVAGDQGRLRQILFNLIGNSVKFTDEGDITLSVHPLQTVDSSGQPRLGYLHSNPSQATVLLRLSDTGHGIDDQEMELIFDAFSQVQRPMQVKHQGTGLGLGIVRRLLSLMGGTLCVSSEKGAGTTVSFVLPFVLPASEYGPGIETGRGQSGLNAAEHESTQGALSSA